jgi:hypothetical protein
MAAPQQRERPKFGDFCDGLYLEISPFATAFTGRLAERPAHHRGGAKQIDRFRQTAAENRFIGPSYASRLSNDESPRELQGRDCEGRKMSAWREASQGEPCPVCEKPDWCSIVGPEGAIEAAVCMRVESTNARPNGGWFHRVRESNNGFVPSNGKPSRIVAQYDYLDEHGELVFQVVRFDPKDFRQRRPNPDATWNWSVKGCRVLPYRLPDLLAADPARTVYVVEGEKDVDNLYDCGYVATCNHGGAGKWRDEHSKFLVGRNVVVLADNDDAGRNHARGVKTSLAKFGVTAKVVELPGLPDKGDVSDWLRANPGADLEQVAQAAGEPEAVEEPPASLTIFDRWAQGILDRTPQEIYYCADYGSDIGKFQFGPGDVVMIGAPPAAGKTAFCGQVVFDALRMAGQEGLRLLIANVEMSPEALLTRQLSRTSTVSYSYLQFRDYCEDAKPRIENAIAELRKLIPRVEFLRPPFTLQHLRERAEDFEANVVLVDYAQRFTTEGKQTDLRTQTNAVMDCCRLLADQGRAVIVVSALSRQKSSGGSTYDSKSLGLASFRESSELEYGADSAWLLLREPNSEQVELRQVKNRTGRLATLQLLFDGNRQSFRDDPSAMEWKP